jgi:hypothetical protein
VIVRLILSFQSEQLGFVVVKVEIGRTTTMLDDSEGK